jgi:hypothetical protein
MQNELLDNPCTGFDLTLGYGLKSASSFGRMHLGWNGKQKMEENGLR